MIRRSGIFLAALFFLSALPAMTQTPPAQTPPAGQPPVAAPQTQAPAPQPQVPTPQQQAPAPQPQTPAAKAPAAATPAPAPAAAAAPVDTVRAILPFAPVRTVITTEKPIQGKPSGIIPPAVFLSGDDSSQDGGESTNGKTASPSAGGDSSRVAVVPPQQRGGRTPSTAPQKPRKSDNFREENSIFNRPTENLRTMKVIIDDEFNLVGMVYGESTGFIRVLSADNNGDFKETWKSPPLNSEPRGVFVDNLDRTGEAEIVTYTREGNIFIYGYDTHDLKYKSPDGTYPGIACMTVANVDDSPELELLFLTTAGKMIQFDPVTKFEEWTSSETYKATDIVIGNVDNDTDPEIILNTGEVLNVRFKSVKWKMDSQFIQENTRLYLVDMDSDGILELVVKYDQQFVRIFDVDQRREKW